MYGVLLVLVVEEHRVFPSTRRVLAWFKADDKHHHVMAAARVNLIATRCSPFAVNNVGNAHNTHGAGRAARGGGGKKH